MGLRLHKVQHQLREPGSPIAPLRRFPPLREGNRAWHTRSVPPACMGNLQKGGVECPRFGEVWLDG
jgi:hypothetical protein